MAKLKKAETVTDTNYYEVELTDEELSLYKTNEDDFFEIYVYGMKLDWEWVGEEIGTPNEDITLENN